MEKTDKKKPGAILLITAFEPFGGAKTNSSHILLEKLKKMDWDGRVEFFGPVTVSFEEAWKEIEKEIKKNPDIKGVIALGQAAGSERLSLERFALNWNDGHTPDNCGFSPKSGEIEKGAPKFLRAGFPWQDLEKSPHWEHSTYAGTYVCNNVMFKLLRWAKEEGKTAGFIHIPLLASQTGDEKLHKDIPRMDDEDAVKSFTRIIEFSLGKLDQHPAAKPDMGFVKKFPPPRLSGGPRP